MFGIDSPDRRRTRTAWRPDLPRTAAPLPVWILVALLVPLLLIAAILALG